MLDFILLLVGAICFGLSALNVDTARVNKVHLLSLGLLFWILVPLINAYPGS